MQVSTNGLISFRDPFSSHRVMTFSPSFKLFQDAIVAPFWLDLDPETSGSVFARSTRDQHILNQTVELVAESNSEFGSFRPTLVVIVTWAGVALYNHETIQVRL